MERITLTFLLYVTEEQASRVQDGEETGEFGTDEAVALIAAAHDASLMRVDHH